MKMVDKVIYNVALVIVTMLFIGLAFGK